ncbi:uncharacterized protein PV09_01471 [Verruconis gallopava]|uniref:Vesicle tethering protein Uso1/P115-like head domain-containing protein n=1 Tax=Verruconis gallopava TaxID=253628 RepID=A0A0D1XXP9_9PEZI|nr:uncharacterized protein PV09_01471 [Verruconis gallopava]KIW07506.1 hypothetical protein PV09_01471 [Verruconis gallopava]
MLRMLEAQAPAKQTAGHTIDTLSNRLSNASLLEDRRAAIHGLRSFAKDYPASVASGALRPLIACLTNDIEDVDTIKPVLETLLGLFNPSPDSLEASEDIALWLADEFTTRQDNIQILLDLLDSSDFYSRLYSLRLVQCIFAARPERTQECILGAALGTSRLVASLDDSRDAIRNAGLVLLSEITRSSTELQKLVAFENAFDRVFKVIKMEGSLSQGGIIVQDCLELLANLVTHNPSNQSLFRESGCVSKFAQLLQEAHKTQIDGEEAWPTPQKEKNIWGLLGVIRLFLAEGAVGTQENQIAFFRHGLLQQVIELAFHQASQATVQAEALYACADMVRGNPTLQTNFAGLQVPAPVGQPPSGQNGHTNGVPKVYIIEALLDLSVVPSSSTPFEVRMAACECIKAYFYKHAEVRHHFLNRAIEGHLSGQDETANVVSILLREELKTGDPYRVWFAADLVFHLLWEDSKAKNMLMTVTEGDAESGEEVVTCIQTLTENLLMAIQREEDERIVIAYFTVLCGWLFEDGSAVNDFLGEGSNVQILKQRMTTGGPELAVIKGLCAVLLGVIYEFSTKDSPIPRRKLQPLLTAQLGRERYLQALSQLRQHPLIRDFEVVPQGAAPPSAGGELPPYAFFDATFVDFLKDNFSRLSRAIDRDPGLEVQIHSKEAGVDRDLVDSLRAQLDEKVQAVQKLETDLLSLQRQLDHESASARKAADTSTAEINRIRQINEALQRNHEADLEKLKKEHALAYTSLQESSERKIQDLQQQIEAMKKASAEEAARTKEYYERSINQLRNTKTGLESRLSEAQKKEESYREMSHKSQQALRQGVEELTSARKHIAELETKLKERDKHIEALQVKETELKEQLEDERTKITMLEKEASEFDAKLEKKGNELKKKEEERQAAQTELDDLMIILADLEEKRANDKKRLQELGVTVSDDEDEDGDDEDNEEDGEVD